MLKNIIISAQKSLDLIENLDDLHQMRVQYFGKSGLITEEMKKLGMLKPENRKLAGKEINTAKEKILRILEEKHFVIEEKELNIRLQKERIDLTIPAKVNQIGGIHPITQCLEELLQVFSKYGFEIKDGPDIEDEWHNFTALNIEEDHPSRQMHDTFYLNKTSDKAKLLRTQTSPVQIRTMKNEKPPFRFISPGRTYRSDWDITHTPMFHQIEGLVIDKNIHMGHLKHTIISFIEDFFEKTNIKARFRPSFFPFTEPSAEVDIKMNQNDKWLEVLGCGMVHPKVLQNVGIDSNEYQGFAFGLGIERFAMLKYNINDLRQFFEGDIRWSSHYNFSALDIPSIVEGLTR